MAIAPLELTADRLVQYEPCFPILFRANTYQAVTSKFYSSAKFGNLRQEGELFRFSSHTDHQVHLVEILLLTFQRLEGLRYWRRGRKA